MVEVNKITYVLIDLSKNDIQEYYNGLANSVLWPILHYRVDLQEYSRADASGYMRVNRLFADRLSPLLRDDDVIWVHDYHLMLLGRELQIARPPQYDRVFPPYALRAARHSCRRCRTTGRFSAASPITISSASRPRTTATISPITWSTQGATQTRSGLRIRRPEGASRRLPGQHRNEGLYAPRAQRRALGDGRAGAREPRRQPPRPRRRSARLFERHTGPHQGVRAAA